MDSLDPTSPTLESSPHTPTTPKSRNVPSDLPTSLDDRRNFSSYAGETEMYDGWQGKKPLSRAHQIDTHISDFS
jgi:hypothetical protein